MLVNIAWQHSVPVHCISYMTVVCYRYVTLVWRSGSSRLLHRRPLADDVAPSRTWHRRCSEMLTRRAQSNMTSTVSAFCCGNCCQKINRLNMVRIDVACLFASAVCICYTWCMKFTYFYLPHGNGIYWVCCLSLSVCLSVWDISPLTPQNGLGWSFAQDEHLSC